MDHFYLLNKINSLIFWTYNTFCAKGLFAFRYPFMRKKLKRNKEFRNKHKGERCFILGLGPSLKSIDLKSLNNETVFCVNHFHLYDKENIVKPKYYCLIDDAFYRGKDTDTTKLLTQKYEDAKFFLNIRAHKVFREGKRNNMHYLYSKYIQYNNYIKTDASKNMTAGMNVIHTCVQLALYMGFSEIFLIGCDFNYLATKSEQHHVYDSKSTSPGPVNSGNVNWQRLTAAFYHHDALSKKAQKMGVKVYNMSKVSAITSYEYKSAENALS